MDPWLYKRLDDEEYMKLKRDERLEQEYFLKKKHQILNNLEEFLERTADNG